MRVSVADNIIDAASLNYTAQEYEARRYNTYSQNICV